MAKEESALDNCHKHLGEMEEYIQSQHQRLANIIEAANVGTWERNMQTDEIWINQRWAEMLGYTLSELVPVTIDTLKNLIHPDDFEAVEKEAFDVYQQDKKYYNIECRLKHKKGHWIWVQANGKVTSWAEDAKPLKISGTTSDITERKQAEELLKEHEEQFRAMFEKHYAVMLLIDPVSGNIIKANQGAETYYGYKAAELEAMSINQINQLSMTEIASEMTKAKTQKRNYFNFIHRLANGEMRHVEVHSSPIPFMGKTILFSIIYDVTDRKQAEEALMVARQQAEKANEAKSRYLSHMNHEIRTPLNGLLGFLQLMETTVMDAEQKEYMKQMRMSTIHLLSIANNVLDMGKIEAGEMNLSKRPFNLWEELEISLASLRPLAMQKNLQLQYTVDDQLPPQVEGDPDRLRQIILNLGSNAVKFTREGRVCIDISCPETTQEHHLLKLVVEDTGEGMAPETLAKLFKPYYQVDDGATPQTKGTGLGMAITRELVDRMGGRIQVESTLGKRTKVEVTLKLKKA